MSALLEMHIDEFTADVAAGQMTSRELAEKYDVSLRTVYYWKNKVKEPITSPKRKPRKDALNKNKVRWRELGNYGEAESESSRIKTVDQLKAAIELDEDVWEVLDSGVKKWEVGAKEKIGNLEWEDGAIVSGNLFYNGVQVQDLYSVWIRCRKRKVQPLTPTIQPIECPVSYRVTQLEPGPVLASFLWSDPQFGYRWDGYKLIPFHDREVLDLWLQIATWLQPSAIDILGDWFDATGWTDHFINDPDSDRTTQPAVLESHWWLRQFREACPNTEITIHEGNHDARITKAIKRHLPVAYRLHPADEMELPPSLSPARLLALHKLDIRWVEGYPNDESWLGDSMRLNHGVYYSSTRGGTARKSVEASDVNTVSGHNHRSESASRTAHYRNRIETMTAYSIGCSCRIDGAVPSKHKYNDWQQSAAVVHFTENHHSFTHIPVLQDAPKEAIADGRLFVARNRVGDLKRDLPQYPW